MELLNARAIRGMMAVLLKPGGRGQIMAAIRHEQYLIRSQAIGVSEGAAEAELRKVREEGVPGDDHETAWQRLIAGERRG
jgi:hypothetical protein